MLDTGAEMSDTTTTTDFKIRAKGVNVHYGDKQAIMDVSLDIGKNEVIASRSLPKEPDTSAAELAEAWKAVSADREKADWCVFHFADPAASPALSVFASGDGGFPELKAALAALNSRRAGQGASDSSALAVTQPCSARGLHRGA